MKPCHGLREQAESKPFYERYRTPRTRGSGNIKRHVPRARPLRDQFFHRTVHDSERVRDVIGGSEGQYRNRNRFADQRFCYGAHSAITAGYRNDVDVRL